MKHTNAVVDVKLKAIEIAKEITIAKLATSAPQTTDEAAGTKIGQLFLAIHSEVEKAFNESETK
ncbi:hypothetical protein IW492_02955 [Enterococcus sp. BWB1-3]|uniref:hypothetical protein n=1 Tax=Enterococcus sp. BWB1-3 TaxID=2787713 RepID=UPI001920D579|nr:hypothetical protein [Enterococcus sp. BWB1-3]MBL1228191.1 hypothetical protein [Enterococcus sp. BWB1-3]